MKNRTEKVVGKLKLGEVPEKLWMHISVDFITKLLIVAGKDAILVICNRLSKMAYFIAITEETIVEGLVRLFRDNVWRLYGLPESVVSDRGPQFAAELTKELNGMLDIKKKTVNYFLPSNRWTNRMHEPGVRTVPLVFCRPQAKGLARVVSISRVYYK